MIPCTMLPSSLMCEYSSLQPNYYNAPLPWVPLQFSGPIANSEIYLFLSCFCIPHPSKNNTTQLLGRTLLPDKTQYDPDQCVSEASED
ncbi:hypothetical protein XELAEV_18003083mg [Xenopus laevis]|nr:hypothetical protein XELAEV_18003083mg [Xenopus laevis]